MTLIQYADSSSVAFTYDAAGRLTQIADSISGTIYHTYDGLDDLLSESGPMGTVTYSYNNAGQRTSMTVATQPSITYSYDGDGRLSAITQGSSSVAITYDAAARRSTLALPGGTTAAYTYDSSSRLTELDYMQGSTLLGNLTYSYDAAGRRTAVGGTLAGTGLPSALTEASYDAANRLIEWNGSTLTYDSNGNLLTDGTLTYGWNARNQLVSLTGGSLSAAFQYDALGRRQAKAINSSQTNFLFDGGNAVQEQAIDGSVIANILTGLGVDENYVRNDATGSQVFLIDPLQSTLGLVGAGGTLTAQYTYDPFGNTAATGSSGNTAQFTGRENDGTGLYFYRARYYSPALQRFVSQDPIGFKGGINLYAYAGGNPISLRDPMGTDPHREPNPYIGDAADALSAAGAAAGKPLPGYLGTAISLANDPSLPNYLLALAGLSEPLGDAIAAATVVQDLAALAGEP
jgi:RHS repeat-associated protein